MIFQTHVISPYKGTAIISPCEKYRYVLTRELPCKVDLNHTCLFIMLNPSTADANLDDRTITRCIGFAQRMYCNSLVVVNCFAWRATDPKELRGGTQECIGQDNIKHVKEQIEKVGDGPIIAAWGAHKEVSKSPIPNLLMELRPLGVHCLAKTKSGAPKHPLYIAANKELEVWKGN